MRRGLGADPRAGLLGRGQGLDRLDAREMLEVHARAFVERERAVPGDHRRLGDRRDPGQPEAGRDATLVHDPVSGERRILFMQRDHAAAQALVLQRLAQHSRGHDRLAVVGEAQRAVVAQLSHLGQLLAPEAARDRGEESHRHPGLTGGSVDQRAQYRRLVDDRVGVRHRDQGDEPSGGGRRGAGVEVLLVLLAGRAQVDVRDRRSRGRRACRWRRSSQRPPARSSVPGLPSSAISPWRIRMSQGSSSSDARIEHVGSLDQQLSRLSGAGEHPSVAVVVAHATAARTGEPTSSS